MSGYFPMFFDIEGKEVLIVGAGNIALRRVETLLSFGTRITVVAPQWKEEIGNYSMGNEITLLKTMYTPDLIGKNYFMILAATDSESLNHQICQDGKEKGILVNNASDKTQCDFYFPAIARQGDVIAGICAGGKDHRLVRKVASGMRNWMKEFMSSEN